MKKENQEDRHNHQPGYYSVSSSCSSVWSHTVISKHSLKKKVFGEAIWDFPKRQTLEHFHIFSKESVNHSLKNYSIKQFNNSSIIISSADNALLLMDPSLKQTLMINRLVGAGIISKKTELPVAFYFTKANVHDSQAFTPLYHQVKSYDTRFHIVSLLADKGYDSSRIRQTLLIDEVQPIIKVSKTRIKPQYPAWFLKKYRKRTSVERFFSRLKTYLDMKRLNLKGIAQLKLASYLISIGMLFIAFLNSKTDCSPRSIKSFIRHWM
jgi:transposase